MRVAVENEQQLAVVPTEGLDLILHKTLRSPNLFPFWNAHSLLLLCAYICLPAFRHHAANMEAAADDSAGGMVTQELFRRLGLIGRELSVASPDRRLSDLKGLFIRMPNLAIASDSHGPYRCISTGMARIVRQYDGNVIPLSAVATRSFHIFKRIRMAVPLPSTTILVGIGSRLGSTTKKPISAVADELAGALRRLEANLTAVLSWQNR